MGSNDSRLHRREQAIALRGAGKSRSQIKVILRIGNGTLNSALKGEPPPKWARRARGLRMTFEPQPANSAPRVHIHETADVYSATRYWADLLDAPLERFNRPSFKRQASSVQKR